MERQCLQQPLKKSYNSKKLLTSHSHKLGGGNKFRNCLWCQVVCATIFGSCVAWETKVCTWSCLCKLACALLFMQKLCICNIACNDRLHTKGLSTADFLNEMWWKGAILYMHRIHAFCIFRVSGHSGTCRVLPHQFAQNITVKCVHVCKSPVSLIFSTLFNLLQVSYNIKKITPGVRQNANIVL